MSFSKLALIAVVLSVAVAVVGFPVTASAAIFMRIEGIEGESTVEGHGGEIELESFSWGLTQSTGHYSSADGARGKQRSLPDAIVVGKEVDKATPKLMLACAAGTHFAAGDVTIEFTRSVGVGVGTYLEISLEDCIISSHHISSSTGEGAVEESVSLNFARIELKYTLYDDTGVPAAPIVFRWDFDLDQPY